MCPAVDGPVLLALLAGSMRRTMQLIVPLTDPADTANGLAELQPAAFVAPRLPATPTARSSPSGAPMCRFWRVFHSSSGFIE